MCNVPEPPGLRVHEALESHQLYAGQFFERAGLARHRNADPTSRKDRETDPIQRLAGGVDVGVSSAIGGRTAGNLVE
jgi:hypothetical protein